MGCISAPQRQHTYCVVLSINIRPSAPRCRTFFAKRGTANTISFFQSLEKTRRLFPTIGKLGHGFRQRRRRGLTVFAPHARKGTRDGRLLLAQPRVGDGEVDQYAADIGNGGDERGARGGRIQFQFGEQKGQHNPDQTADDNHAEHR